MTDWTAQPMIKAIEQGNGQAADLVCPRCGAQLLHHHMVTSCDRQEDAAITQETAVRHGFVKALAVNSNASINPSSRRAGVVIHFWCEGCGGEGKDEIRLNIAQHKGSTEIFWSYTDKGEGRWLAPY